MRTKFWPSASSDSSQRPKKNWEQYTKRDPNPAPLIGSRSSSKSPNVSYDNTTKLDWGFDPWASSPSSVAVTEHDHHRNLFQEEQDGSRMGLPAFYETVSPPYTHSAQKSRSNNVSTRTSNSARAVQDTRLRRSQSPSNAPRNTNARNVVQRQLDFQMENKVSDSNAFSTSRRTHLMSPPSQPCTSSSGKNTHQREDFTVPATKPMKSQPIVPGVAQMTLRQILSLVFAAFWDRADLYTDVLALYNDQPTPRQLTLAFLRQGRLVLATPIESPDDMTLLSAGAGVLGSGAMGGTGGGGSDGMSTISVVRAGTPVSRKAKLKFQAISLAYELLRDEDMRKAYDEWRKWNLRLPPPVEDDRDLLEDDADNGDSFVARYCPDAPRLPKHSLKYRDNPNVTSILRKSNKPSSICKYHERLNHSEKDRTTVSKQKQKAIRWNEEVEELTITEQLPPYDPVVDNEFNKENLKYDPYGYSAEEWFGSVDHTLPRYGRFNKSVRPKDGSSLHQQGSNTKAVPFAVEPNSNFVDNTPTRSSRSRRVARDIRSSNSSTFFSEEPSSGGVVFEGYNLDDSLMLILDGPESSHTTQNNVHSNLAGTENRPWNRERVDIEKRMNSSDGNIASARTISNSTHSPSVPVQTCKDESQRELKDGNDKRQAEKGVASQSQSSFTPSLQSVDFTSLGSASPSTECRNDCDIGRTFDLAKGFQASLSNYINAAVEDMKEGLKVMGKHWDDLELTGSSSGEQKNFFFLDAGELDAMMSILKEEMEAIPNPFATATTCNAVPLQTSVEQKSGSKGLFNSFFSNLKK